MRRALPKFRHRTRLSVLCALLVGISTTAVALPAGADDTSVGGYGSLLNGNLRQNWDDSEPGLTRSDVVQPDFGKLWSTTLDNTTSATPNQQYAQPLVYNGKVYAATQDNEIEVLDERNGTKVASVNLGTPWTPQSCDNISPHVGVVPTPVIDTATKTLYVLTKLQVPGTTKAVIKMWALSSDTLATKTGWPLTIQGLPTNANIAFNPTTANPRPGLMLDSNHAVYFASASHCDFGPYVGYVGRVSTTGSTPSLKLWSAESGNAIDEAGIWESGAGIMSDGNDSTGNPRIFVATGNGVSPAPGPGGSKTPGTLGEAVVRLGVDAQTGAMSAKDYFSPANNEALNGDDADLGSGGPVALPASFGDGTNYPHMTTLAGKDGTIYLLNRDNLGGTAQGPVVNGKRTDAALSEQVAGAGIWGHAGVFDGGSASTRLIYYLPSHQPLKAFKVSPNGATPPVPTLSPAGTSSESYAYGSGSPVVTSVDGDPSSAVVWITVADGGNDGTGGYLVAYPAVPPTGAPWKPLAKFPIGTQNKFSNIATSDGKVFVGTKDGKVLAFGRPTSSAVSTPPTDFGSQPVGSTPTTKTVTLTATRPVQVSGVDVSGNGFGEGTPQPAATHLNTGDTLQVPVTFSPPGPGTNTGTLTVHAVPDDTGQAIDYPFALTGIGTQDGILADPTSIDFGKTAVKTGVNQSVTIQNTGTSPETITHVTPPAAGAFQFYGSPPQVNQVIQPQGSATFTVEFLPPDAVHYTGSFSVGATVTDPNNPNNGKEYTSTVQLKGLGQTGSPHLTFSSPLMASGGIYYADVPPGQTSSTNLTITNDGNVADVLNKAGVPAKPFFVPHPYDEGITLQPGDSLSVQIQVIPTTGVSHIGQYIISDSTGPHPVKLSVNTHNQAGEIRGTYGCVTDRELIRVNGNPVVDSPCNNTSSQILGFDSASYLHWFATYGHACMDVVNASTKPGATVQYLECNHSPAQQWTFSASGKMVNPHSKLCLAVKNSITAPNTPLILASCSSTSKGELWDPTGVITKRGELTSGLGADGLFCVTGPAYGAARGTAIDLQQCSLQYYSGADDATHNPRKSQVIAHVGTTLRVSGGCLTQAALGTGQRVVIAPCLNARTQQWTSGANHSLVNPASKLCLNVYGGAPTATSKFRYLTSYTCNGSLAQIFTLPDT